MQLSSVDLPEPDGPMTAVKLPRSRVRLTPSSAATAFSPEPYVLCSPSTFSAGGLLF